MEAMRRGAEMREQQGSGSFRGAATAVGVALAVLVVAPATARADLVVRTDRGAVRGLTTGTVEKFLGIRYAAPPVGALRWRPPARAASWKGVRAAVRTGPRCPQVASYNGPRVETEDCLYVNVYRPARRAAQRLPVLFWIHGGGLVNGSGDQHDGTLMANAGGLVVVSFNYRLGIFGFLGLPGLSAEAADHASGNYGLLDQQAALAWTRRNIAAFGGDPRNVTIAGESAGGWSVCAQLASPLVRGKFAAAIMQSGSCASRSLADTERSGATFAGRAGCPDPATVVACLRAKPVGALLDATPPGEVEMVTSAGRALPRAPADAVTSGDFSHVPLLIGSNRNEMRTFSQDFAAMTREQYEGFVRSNYGANAERILARYPFTAYPAPYTAAYAIGDLWTDSGSIGGIGGCATLALTRSFAHTTRTYGYQFEDLRAPHLNLNLPGFRWGAGHAMELPYHWPAFDNSIPMAAQFTRAQQQLAGQMVAYWAAFAATHRPAAPDAARW